MNEVIKTETLINEHPQLKEKALIDFVNGIEVIDDHIRFQDKTNQVFFGRIWSDLTGESHLRQNTINQHVNQSLDVISDWLQFLEKTQIESDLAIAKVSEKLAETRAGVMRLNAKHNELAKQVELLIINFDKLENRFDQLSAKLQQVDAGRLASQHLEAVFDKWKAGRLNHYPVLIRLHLVFDELYWGDFGNYCRKYNLEKEIKRLIEQAKNKTLIQLKLDLEKSGIDTKQAWIWQEWLSDEIQNLETDYKELLAYLTDDANENLTPMLWVVNRLANGETNVEINQQVPIILNTQNTIERFARDFEVRNAQQRN